MKVLMIQVDVSNLSEEEIEALIDEMVRPTEECDSVLLNCKVATVDEETGEVQAEESDEDPEDPTNIH
jgi:hypothetical protein